MELNLLCNFKRGHHGEHSVKFYGIWTSGSGGNAVKRYFLSRALAAPLFSGLEPFVQFFVCLILFFMSHQQSFS